MEVSSVVRNSIGAIPRVSDPEEAIASLPRPDLSQMIPYKPKVNALPGEHPVPGKYLYMTLIIYNNTKTTLLCFYFFRWFFPIAASCGTVMYYFTTSWML